MKRFPLVGDEYDQRARLQPVFIVMLPATLAIGLVTAHVPGGWDVVRRVGLGALVSAASSVGLIGLLAQFGRDQGKKKEPGLWESWGGPPTTQMLRHRELRMTNPVNRERYHA